MRPWLQRALWGLASAIGGPVIAVLLLYLQSDTSQGQRTIEGLAALFSGGQIGITGLDGTFPDSLRAGHIEIRDAKGTWLALDNIAIEWSPWGFLHDHVPIKSAHAAHATLLRFPIPSENTAPATTRYDIGSLIVDRADFSKDVTGHPVSIALRARGHYTNEDDAQWLLSASGVGNSGTYDSEGTIDAKQITAAITAHEPAHGLLESLAGLPDLGAMAIEARTQGPRKAERLDATITAGEAQLSAHGNFDRTMRTIQMDVSAHSPALKPRPDLSWASLGFDGHATGTFDQLQVYGRLSVDDLHAFGIHAQSLSGDLSSYANAVRFSGTATELRMPGPQPDVLAAAPLQFQIDANFTGKAPKADLIATHPLIKLTGHTVFGDHLTFTGTANLLRVAPFAALGGVDLDGTAALIVKWDSAHAFDVFSVNGTVNGGGPTLLSRLLARGTHIAFAAKTTPTSFEIQQGDIAGPALKLSVQGTQSNATLDFAYTADLVDASRLGAQLNGSLHSQGHMTGETTDFSVTGTAAGGLASKGYPQGPISLNFNAQGLPNKITGAVNAFGRFDAAPLRLAARFEPNGNGRAITLQNLDWRSLHATGSFAVPRNARSATGRAEFHIGQLADIGALIGQAMKGAATGTFDIAAQNGHTVGRINAKVSGFSAAGVAVQSSNVTGTIAEPLGKANVALTLKANGFATGGVSGSGDAKLNGALDALHVAFSGNLKSGIDTLPVAADATLNLAKKTATVAHLETTYRGAPFRLAAPAHADFAKGLSVDRFHLVSNNAEIDIAGRLSPTLAATVTLRNASPKLIQVFAPSLDAEGTLSGEANLAGSLAAPTGTLSAHATSFRLRGIASGLPPANIAANGTLHGKTMALTARIEAGKSAHLSLDGSVPLQANGAFDLKATGTIDLAVLDPVLTANGRRLRGIADINGRFTGTFDNPRASGTAALTGGEFDDYLQGVRINNIAANLEAKGDTITISKLTGRAGHGTVSGHGTIALWADGIPLNLAIAMNNARPIATDLFNADLNADLKLSGKLRDRLLLSGSARIDRGEVNIAESYPPDVAVLDIRHSRKQPAPKAPPPRTAINLDLTVAAPGQIFVRGRGLDAQTGGSLTVKGTSITPIVMGGFTMRRGELNLGGTSVRFTSGKITFDGRSLNGSFDPALDFAAESTTGSVTAKLAITGHASTPHIELSSTPTLPQDEVLAHLLFGQSISQLNPLQLAQIAQAIAALGSMGGGFNPLGAVRRSLGLDRLAVGAAASGSGATVEVGKNIGSKVYVGAKQSTGGGTQATVQVDLTEHLKLQSTVTAAPFAAPTTGTATKQDNGNSVGLSYQFEY